MKQLLTLLLITIGFFAKSAETKPAAEAVKAFETKYGKSTTAAWAFTAQGYEAQFELNGQVITAVYSPAGQLRGYKKHILSTGLPVSLQMSLKKMARGYWVSDVIEQSSRQGTAYTITIENGFQQKIMKSVGGQWQLIKTLLKA
ncbi:MAG: hypothetical protein EON98_09630 [Chitinophagaceae bacterium]|nr:MAG: hypothetical protein EON98_09630 [Chitinophagaceae bacterium]